MPFPKSPDFIAKLQYKTTEEGGRTTKVFSNYRPHIEFDGIPDLLTSGQQVFLDKEEVNPGDRVKAEITVLSSDLMKGKLHIGQRFKFCEGSRVIGTGEIASFLNVALEV